MIKEKIYDLTLEDLIALHNLGFEFVIEDGGISDVLRS